jgi:hypothetical protein
MLRTILWMTATIVIAIGAIAIGDDRFEEAQAQTACTGPASHQLENTLFTARALSQNGADPVCTPAVEDADDSDAVMLSHRGGIRPSSRLAGRL